MEFGTQINPPGFFQLFVPKLSDDQRITCDEDSWMYPYERMGVLHLEVLLFLWSIQGLYSVISHWLMPCVDVVCRVQDIPSTVAGATIIAAGVSIPGLTIHTTSSMMQGSRGEELGVTELISIALWDTFVICGFAAVTQNGLIVDAKIVLFFVGWMAVSTICMVLAFTSSPGMLFPLSQIFCYIYVAFLASLLYIVRKISSDTNTSANSPVKAPEAPAGKTKQASSVFAYSKEDAAASEESHLLNQGEQGTLSKCWWVCNKAWGVTIGPWDAMFNRIVLDCISEEERAKYWPITLVQTFFYTFLVTFFMVFTMNRVICWTEAPVSLAATLLAIIDGIPDIIASLTAVNLGHNDFAISIALGAFVFNMLLGTAVPWFAVAFIWPLEFPSTVLPSIQYYSLASTCAFMLWMAAVVAPRGRITKFEGWVLLSLYGGYVLIVVVDSVLSWISFAESNQN